MAHILNEAGFTQFDNKLIVAIAGAPLNGLENSILLILLRQTVGYHRASAPLPLSFICAVTKAKKQNVARAVRNLIERKVILETNGSSGRAARELSINARADEWQFDKNRAALTAVESSSVLPYTEEEGSVESSATLPYTEEEYTAGSSQGLPEEEKAAESSPALPEAEVREPQGSSGRLPQSHQCDDPLNINKYKYKKAVAVVVDNTVCGSRPQKQKAAAAIRTDPENQNIHQESILPIFLLVFGRNPNPIEKEELEKILTEDPELPWSEAFRIYEVSIRIIAISEDKKKNVRYLIGIIKSEKTKALKRLEKGAAAKQMHETYQRGAETVWEPGAFLRMWEDSTGQKFYPESG